jgi:integrase
VSGASQRPAASPLRQALADYLTVRRSLGFKLARDEKLLAQFLTYLEDRGVTTITVEHAMAWVTLPEGAGRSWLRMRLSVVRGFARWLRFLDPDTQVPPSGLLPPRRHRAVPYLYSSDDLAALINAADGLRTPLRALTYQTLIGLLAVSGMRIGEAIRLDLGDFDARHGVLTVTGSKFGKSRQIPLHPATVAALRDYLRHRGRHPQVSTEAVFVSTAGTRLMYVNVSATFVKLVARAGLKARSAKCHPRIHDLRHSFTVSTLLDWYRDGGDVQARLPLLSTYLGHVDPKSTYWYLQAAPELLAMAGQRLDDHLEGRP